MKLPKGCKAQAAGYEPCKNYAFSHGFCHRHQYLRTDDQWIKKHPNEWNSKRNEELSGKKEVDGALVLKNQSGPNTVKARSWIRDQELLALENIKQQSSDCITSSETNDLSHGGIFVPEDVDRVSNCPKKKIPPDAQILMLKMGYLPPEIKRYSKKKQNKKNQEINNDYKKVYTTFFGYFEGETILCESCKSVAVDIHHIDNKGMGGSKNKDYIENLVALCRKCHDDCHNDKELNKRVLILHLKNVIIKLELVSYTY